MRQVGRRAIGRLRGEQPRRGLRRRQRHAGLEPRIEHRARERRGDRRRLPNQPSEPRHVEQDLALARDHHARREIASDREEGVPLPAASFPLPAASFLLPAPRFQP
jgi:hypothetical protein